MKECKDLLHRFDNLNQMIYPKAPGTFQTSALRQAFYYLDRDTALHAAATLDFVYHSFRDIGDENTARHLVPLLHNRISWEMLKQALALRGQE